MATDTALDDPTRIEEIRALIKRKHFLYQFYGEVYAGYAACVARTPKSGTILELGSGAGFAKNFIPEITTSDTLPYHGVDRVIDATKMPFPDASLRAICMMNVFHHIPDVSAFLAEATRCLVPGGRIFIRDQHVGWMSRVILKHIHHEPFNPDAEDWKFASTGPLSGANGALSWIVFQRDRAKFEKLFPQLKLEFYRPNSPLRYWMAGGLKNWSLLPGAAFGAVTAVENALVKLHDGWCSFVDIEIVKQA